MALKTKLGSEPMEVDRLVTCILGHPGTGKTSLAFTASNPLVLDFDDGARRAIGRKDIAIIQTWEDVMTINAEDVAQYDTIVIDTAGRALDILSEYIIRTVPKSGNGVNLSRQGYGALKNQFIGFLNKLRTLGKDVVLLAHTVEDKQGEETKLRMNVQGGSKQEIYQVADIMGVLSIRGGKITLDLNPADDSYGKNPGQLPAMEVPNPLEQDGFLASVIQRTKDAMNAMTAEQEEVAGLQQEFAAVLKAATTQKALSELVMKVKDLDPRVQEFAQRMIKKERTARGLIWKDGKFVKAPAGETA